MRYVPVSTNAAVLFGGPDSLFHPGFWQSNFLKELNEVDNAAPNPVTISSPGGGEFIGSRYFTVTWVEANPRDVDVNHGDCVFYSMDYSTDDGTSWFQAIDNNGDDIDGIPQGNTSIIWDLGSIQDTTKGRIRICVTDSYGNIVTETGACVFTEVCTVSNKFTITGGSCF